MISCASPGSGRGERLITPPVRASPQLPPWVLPGLRPSPLDLLRPTALSWSSAPRPLLLVLPFSCLDLSLLTSMFILSLPGFSLWLFPPACPPSLPTSPWLRSLPSPPLFPVPAACSRHLAAPRQPQPCSGLSSLLSLLLFLFYSISFFCSCPPTPTPAPVSWSISPISPFLPVSPSFSSSPSILFPSPTQRFHFTERNVYFEQFVYIPFLSRWEERLGGTPGRALLALLILSAPLGSKSAS